MAQVRKQVGSQTPTLDATQPQKGHPVYSDLATVKDAIGKFIKMLRPKIQEFLTNPRLSNWVPPETIDEETQQFYHNLGVPLLEGQPSILLHNLGLIPNPNVDNLFRGGTNKILYNTSGSGKTRLLFDGLCQHWGFYFVVAQGTDNIGAPDLEATIDMMSKFPGWMDNIFENRTPEDVKNATTNNNIAFEGIAKVLIARWIVFDTFIKVARDLNGGTLSDSIRRDWLLFQILPSVRFDYNMDPFSALIRICFATVNYENLKPLIASFTPSVVLGADFCPGNNFFCVLDEAQVAGKQYMGAFADADGLVQQPVLLPIIQDLVLYFRVNVIISGTRFSLRLFPSSLTSGVGKDSPSDWEVVHTTGDFSNKSDQLAYISRYLPPSFLLSESGVLLKARMYEWLRGRYGFTACYIEELIHGAWVGNRPTAPHKLLNAYVRCFTRLTPCDADNYILMNEKDCYVRSVKIDSFEWRNIKHEQNLLKELAHSIYTYITRGKFPMRFQGKELLVDYGLAQFGQIVSTDDSIPKIQVEEPLALISIMRYFEENNLKLDGNIQARLQDNKGAAFEGIVLLAITKLLRDGIQLKNVFRFHGTIPAWAHCTARIVSRTSSGTFVPLDLPNDRLILPSAGAAFYAKNPGDVKCWLENGETGWCIPGNLMGPNLLTWVRLSNGKLLLLVIQAKCYFNGNKSTVSADVTAEAIRSLIPQRFFTSLVQEQNNLEVQEEIQRGIDEMLGTINEPYNRFTTGQYDILRVVAAFPPDANIESDAVSITSTLSEDNHPLAVLPLSALTAALATTPNGPSITSQLTKTLKRIRRESDSGPKDEQPGPKLGRKANEISNNSSTGETFK